MSRLNGSDVTELYFRIGNCHLLSGGRVAPTRSSLPTDWCASVISFRTEVSETTRIGRFFRGAEFVGSHLHHRDPEVTLRLSFGVIMSKHAVSRVRACRVVWADVYGHVWIHQVLGVQRSAVDARDLVLRLGARRAADVGRWDEDQRLGLGGEKIPLPSVNRLFVVSGEGERVTNALLLTPAKVS